MGVGDAEIGRGPGAGPGDIGQGGDMPPADDDPGPADADRARDVGRTRIGRTFVLDLGQRAVLQVEGPHRTVVAKAAIDSIDSRSTMDVEAAMGPDPQTMPPELPPDQAGMQGPRPV